MSRPVARRCSRCRSLHTASGALCPNCESLLAWARRRQRDRMMVMRNAIWFVFGLALSALILFLLAHPHTWR